MRLIPGFKNYYITKEGKIWSVSGNKFLKPDTNWAGYDRVVLYKNKNRIRRTVHQLVLETYVGYCPENMECCHNNGIRNDNRLSNLRWDTKSANEKDSYKHGTRKYFNGNRGCDHLNTRLKEYDVKMIIYMYKTKLFFQREIAEIYSINKVTVWYIINRKTWKHIWRN